MYSDTKLQETWTLKKKMGIGLVGSRLKEVRERAGLTQHELSVLVNLNNQQIYRYENNAAQPTAINLILMAQVLHVSIDYLCGLTDDPRVKREEDLSENERQLLNAYRTGDMDIVMGIFAEKLRKHRDTKRTTASV